MKGTAIKLVIFQLVLVCGLIASLQANTEYIHQSCHTGRTPYLIVRPDDSGSSERAPGIYYGDPDGQWLPALTGKVLAGETSQGILGEFVLTKSTGRFEAAAVIDGRLVIFNLQSRPDRKDSRIEIGLDGIQPIDIISGRPFKIHKIPSLKDINIALFENESPEGQGFIVSIRQANPFGTGITFAGFLKRQNGSDRVELLGEPRILNYQFHDYAQLKTLIHPEFNKTGVIAEDVLRVYLNNPSKEKEEHPALRLWRKTLQLKLDSTISRAVNAAQRSVDIPRYDLVSQKMIMGAYPWKELSIGHIKLVQVYDPKDRHHRVFFGDKPPADVSRGYIYDGAIEFDEANRNYVMVGSHQVSHVAVAASNLELVLFVANTTPSTPPFVVSLLLEKMSQTLTLSDLSFASAVQKGANGEETIYAFVSRKVPQPKTEVFIISRNGQVLNLKKSYEIFPYFIPWDQLTERVREDAATGTVLFDTLTPVSEDLDSYRKAYRDTIPHLNVGGSSGVRQSQMYQSYLKPMEEVTLNNFTVYRAYDPKGAVNATKSGLFMLAGTEKDGAKINKEDEKNKVVAFNEGQLLRRGDGPQSNISLFSSLLTPAAQIKNQSFPDAAVNLLAIDPSGKNGDAGFHFVFAVTPVGGGPQYFQPFSLSKIEGTISFKQIRSIQALAGRGKNKDRLVVLISVEPNENSPISDFSRTGGLLILNYRISGQRTGSDGIKVSLSEVYTKKLSGVDATRDLANRLAIDKEGRFYLLAQRDIPREDARFKAYDLFADSMREVYPNRQSGKGLDLKIGDEMRQTGVALEEDLESTRVENPWQVLSRSDLKRLSTFSFEEKGDNKGAKRIDEEEKLYPRLAEMLDGLADPSKPSQHTVVLVSQEQKDMFKAVMLSIMTRRQKGFFRQENLKLRFSVFDKDHASQSDVFQNLLDLSDTRAGEKSFLFADATALHEVDRPNNGGDEENLRTLVNPKDADPSVDIPHILDLISREGKISSYQDFQKQPTKEKEISTLILATPLEWEELKAADEDREWFKSASLEKRFNVSSEFLHSNWRVWPAEVKKNRPDVQSLMLQASSSLDPDVFPVLVAGLDELADPRTKPKHRVFLVPPELRPLINKVIFRLYGSKSNRPGAKWSTKNQNLKVFSLDPERSENKQPMIFHNFTAMHPSEKSDRSVLVGDLSTIQALGRPQPGDDIHANLYIQDPALVKTPGSDKVGDFSAEEEDPRRIGRSRTSSQPLAPHLLWFLETEGRRIDAKEFQSWKQDDYEVSTLLLGTKEEWDQLKQELTLENRLGLLDRFEVQELSPPSDKAKRLLVNQVFDRPEIAALGYNFVGDQKATDPRQQLVGFLVNRTELLSRQFGVDSTAGFIRVLNRLLEVLAEDPQARKTKVLDKAFVQRLLTRVFNIPMNLDALPPDDPDVRLSDKRQVAFALQSAGHLGSIGTKFQFLETLQAHLRGGEMGKAVPGSVIIFGDSSTGKTLLIEKFIQVMGLKTYDFNAPFDDTANAFYIKVAEIEPSVKEGEKVGSGYTIDDVKEHIENFLSLPQGYRGYIFIDDTDKAKTADILNGLMGIINRLFEAKGGMMHVRPLDGDEGDETEIPVRNVRLVMALNPPTTPEKKKRFAASKNDVDMIVAALSREQAEVHPAFVMRWGSILKMSHFEAKGPALLNQLRNIARNDFLTGRLNLVDPAAIDSIIRHFPDSNAREFLTPAANQLLATAESLVGKEHKIVMVLPSDRLEVEDDKQRGGRLDGQSDYKQPNSWDASGIDSARIKTYIQDNITALPAGKKNIDGRLVFVSMMVDATRSFIYEKLVEAIMQDEGFAENYVQRENILGPLLHALVAHVKERPALPLKALSLDPHDFGIRTGSTDVFSEALKRADVKTVNPFFPIKLADEFGSVHDVSVLTHGKRQTHQEKTRAHLLLDISVKASALEKQLLSIILRLKSVDSFPSTEQWLEQLTEDEFRADLNKLGGEFLKLFKEYWEELYNPMLAEARRPDSFASMSAYDAARLFLIALDKGMTRMPWAQAQNFLISTIERVAGDMDLSQQPALQHVLFQSKTSIFRPASLDYINQQAESSDVYRKWTTETVRQKDFYFKENCGNFLVQVANGTN